MRVSLKAPAKINLSLDVLRKRPDGYHDVKMVMTTIDLADRIDICERDEDRIAIESTNGFLSNDRRNLVYQAAELIKNRFSIKKGVDIELSKNIPVAAGLAGGSSDAAATLTGLNELWRLGLTTKELATLGSELGSDVAFCVYGGTALATGRGEIIQPIDSPVPCWVVLAKPTMGVSTSDVYRELDVTTCPHPDVDRMVEALSQKDYRLMCESLGNALEAVTLKKYPKVAKIKKQMERLGADGVLMSGSGPTVFGLTRHEARMKRIVNGLRGFCPQVYAVRMLGR